MADHRASDAGMLGVIGDGRVASPAVLRPGTCVVVIAKPDECAAWSHVLGQAGAVVRVGRDVAQLRCGPGWRAADLVVVGTEHAVHADLDEPGAPPFIAVRDALIASELAALLRAGARDVLTRPVAPGELVAACTRVLARSSSRPPRAPAGPTCELPVDGATGVAIARTRLPVMIIGETGSGKSRLGRMIHETLTPHAPFVEVNAGTLPGNLLISEMFGYERGAFTGAVGTKPGLVAAANGGTLFLDEIGELPPDAQAQLLVFLDTGMYRPLGAVRPVRSDARVFTATNRNLEEAVAQGRFREDLYYRLASIVVPMAPLREQRAQLPALIDELLRQAAERAGDRAPEIGRDARRMLVEHRWPGNVRQLRFVLERLVAVWPGQRIGVDEIRSLLGEPAAAKPPPPALAGDLCSLAEMERGMVERAMREACGNRTRAAQLLGITPRGLYNKLRRIGTPFRLAE